MTSFSNEVAFAELYYTRKLIKDILGVTPKCWRPPFGDVDNRVRVIAEGMNMTNIVWSDDTVSPELFIFKLRTDRCRPTGKHRLPLGPSHRSKSMPTTKR